MTTKVRFSRLYAAYAAFGRYAAIMLTRTRVQSGGCSLPHPQGVAIIVKSPLSEYQTKPDFPESNEETDNFSEARYNPQTEAMVQDNTQNESLIQDDPRNFPLINGDFPRNVKAEGSSFFKEINFFVEHQNRYCTEFVEYVFSAWARGLDMNQTNLPLKAPYALSMAKTSVDENQI